MSSTPLNTSAKPQTSAPQATPDQVQTIPNRRQMRTTKKAVKAAPAKSASAFRTISEVADELKVQQHVLRFWESKFAQIDPLKRGGGRRYYRPEDVDLIKNIHHLLYNEGYTIKGVQKLLQSTRGNLSARVGVKAKVEEQSPIAAAVTKNKTELQDMLAELKSMRKLID